MSEYRHLDEIEENLRRMAESSNRIEGFVLFADGFDGFSGVNERLLEFVNDEYDRKSLLFNINEPWSRTTPYRYGDIFAAVNCNLINYLLQQPIKMPSF